MLPSLVKLLVISFMVTFPILWEDLEMLNISFLHVVTKGYYAFNMFFQNICSIYNVTV